MPKRPQSPRAAPSPAVLAKPAGDPKQKAKDNQSVASDDRFSMGSGKSKGSRSTVLSLASARRSVAKQGNPSAIACYACAGLSILSVLVISMFLAPGHHKISVNTYNGLLPRYLDLRSAVLDRCVFQAEESQPALGFPLFETCAEAAPSHEECHGVTRNAVHPSDQTGRMLMGGGSSEAATDTGPNMEVCESVGCLRWGAVGCSCAATVQANSSGSFPAIVELDAGPSHPFPSSECGARCGQMLAADTWPQITTYPSEARRPNEASWTCKGQTGPHRNMEQRINATQTQLSEGAEQLDCFVPLRPDTHPVDCAVLPDGHVILGVRSAWMLVRKGMDAYQVTRRVEPAEREERHDSNVTRGTTVNMRNGQDATQDGVAAAAGVATAGADADVEEAAGPIEFAVSPMSLEYFELREASMKHLGVVGLGLICGIVFCTCSCYWIVLWAQEVEKRLFALGDPDAWDPTAAMYPPMAPKVEQHPESPVETQAPGVGPFGASAAVVGRTVPETIPEGGPSAV